MEACVPGQIPQILEDAGILALPEIIGRMADLRALHKVVP